MGFDKCYWRKKLEEAEELLDERNSYPDPAQRRRDAIQLLILDRLDDIALSSRRRGADNV